MATYKATETVYVDECYIRAGALFTTEAPKGETWEPVEPQDGDGKKGGAKKLPAAED